MKGYCTKHLRRWERHGDPLKKVKRDYRQGTVTKDGYIMLWLKERGNISMHRWIMEKHLGRRLSSKEIVHHINEDPTDNRIENLEVMSLGDHIRLHKTGKFRNPNNSTTHKQCPQCKVIKLRTEYGKCKRNHDGIRSTCLECNRAYCREYAKRRK